MGTLTKNARAGRVRWHRWVLMGALSAWVCGSAVAAPSVAPTTPAEQHLVASGSVITNRFVSSSGLTAIVADNGKEQRLFYLTPDGRSLILGVLFDAQGRNLTQLDMAKAQPASTAAASSAEQGKSAADLQGVLDRASRAAWIADGTKGKIIYAIFDPNCMYCHRLHGNLRSLVADGKVQVRWIPVSILTDSGDGAIAAIYGAKDRAAALTSAFDHVLAPAAVSQPVKLAVARNVLLLRDTGYAGVPVLLYDDGGKPAMHMGLPDSRQLAAIVAQ